MLNGHSQTVVDIRNFYNDVIIFRGIFSQAQDFQSIIFFLSIAIDGMLFNYSKQRTKRGN